VNDSPEPGQGKDIGSAEHTRTVPRKRSAATVLFTDGVGRVLICEPTYKEVWEAPARPWKARSVAAVMPAQAVPSAIRALSLIPGRMDIARTRASPAFGSDRSGGLGDVGRSEDFEGAEGEVSEGSHSALGGHGVNG
jgi:hypothetical protein